MKCIVLEEKDDPEAQWFAFPCMLCGPSHKQLITNYSSIKVIRRSNYITSWYIRSRPCDIIPKHLQPSLSNFQKIFTHVLVDMFLSKVSFNLKSLLWRCMESSWGNHELYRAFEVPSRKHQLRKIDFLQSTLRLQTSLRSRNLQVF